MTHSAPAAANDVGVYIHAPFCERVCPYCDFAVTAGKPGAREPRLVAALEKELAARARTFAGARLASVYFGGGTPSLLQPASLQRLLEATRRAFPGKPAEVTLEVNPGVTEQGRLPAFLRAGITRLSVGVQSFSDAVLKRLGRAHPAADCHAVLDAAHAAGFSNLSIDLMFGVPGQRLRDVLEDAEAALAHDVQHVSTYALTVEAGTPLASAVAGGRVVMPEDDRVAEMMCALAQCLEGAGFLQYELSNYARPGYEALHNARTWQRRPLLGIGPGAHSWLPPGTAPPHGARPANERDFEQWCARVMRGDAEARSDADGCDDGDGRGDRPRQLVSRPHAARLSAQAARGEAMFLALRTRAGLSASAFAAEFGAPPRAFFFEAIERGAASGTLLEDENGDLRLSARGRLLADDLFAEFF